MRSWVLWILVVDTLLGLLFNIDKNTTNVVHGQMLRRRSPRLRYNYRQRKQTRRDSSTTVSRVGRWSNGVIYYQIGRSLRRYQSIIQEAFNRIEAQTCIRFEQRQNQRDYIQIINGNGYGEC